MTIELRTLSDVKPYPNNPQLNDGLAAADDRERWAPIPSFEGLYEVSSFGRVRRNSPSRNDPSGYLLKGRITHKGYVNYSLFRSGRYQHMSGHRLVALAFLGRPPSPGAHAAHHDGNRKNNRLSNLRWASPKENSADKRRHGTARGAAAGELHHHSTLNTALVVAMRRHARAGMNMSAIAGKFGVPKITAYDAIVGKTWTIVTDPKPLGLTRRRAL